MARVIGIAWMAIFAAGAGGAGAGGAGTAGAGAAGAGAAGAGAGASASVTVDRCAVRFLDEIDVPALQSGAVAELHVALNARVEAGERLARLDERALLLQQRAARLQRDAAAEETADQLDLDYALAALKETEAERDASLGVQARSAGAVPESTLRKLRLAVERARLEVERMRKRQRLAQIQVDIRAAELEAIEDRLRRTEITSPLDGVVLAIHRRAGEWVAEGQPVVRLARLDRLQIDAFVDTGAFDPATDLGSPVSVRVDRGTRPVVLRGRVASVDPQIFSGRQYRIHAEVRNERRGDSWELLPGAEATLVIHRTAGAER